MSKIIIIGKDTKKMYKLFESIKEGLSLRKTNLIIEFEG